MKRAVDSTAAELTAISLFSGAGGMDVGVKAAGFEILMANDIDPDACATYRANHGDKIHEGDLRPLIPELRRYEGVDLIFGGPPCQGFSVAGKMNPNDERSKLINSFFDVVDELRPKAFVCENVKALAVLTRWKSVRDQLFQRAEREYRSVLLVLNSSDFGVPQARERMFLIGIRRNLLEGSRSEFAERIQSALRSHYRTPPTLGDVIRSLGPAGSASNSRICRAQITYAKAPVLRKSAYAGMLFNGAGRPLSARHISSTLPASMGGNKTPIVDEDEIFRRAKPFVVGYHRKLIKGEAPKSGKAPSRLRRLTVDECLAIQTFPISYRLQGSQSAQYRQLGNAVPCVLAEAVGKVVRSILEEQLLSSPFAVAAE